MARTTDAPITITDGATDWSAGVNSLKATTVASELAPNGLARNELSWLINGTVRGGGISPRTGWQFLSIIHDSTGYWQGGFMYEPDYDTPYLIVVISGRVYKVDPVTFAFLDLSAAFGLTIPGTNICNFCQAEQFLVIQDGGLIDKPLFWDGATLRRAVAGEIPAATCMDYYMGRLWYAQGRIYTAGDIVKGASGTIGYQFRDAVLKVTENPLAVGGDGFTVPTNAGNIRALKHSANLDTALGQGLLFVFTRKAVYSLSVPVTRSDWIAATNNNQPLQRVVQLVNGSVNDMSVVPMNGDLFYQSLEPSIRSLMMAVRYFDQWGNVAISSNVNRLMRFNDRALMHAANGIIFDNRLLQATLPKTLPQGIVHQALASLDFVPLSTLGQQLPPVWEGVHEGLDILQLFTGDFGGYERAFAITVSRVDSSLQLWELTDAQRFNKEDNRTTWIIEFPSFNFKMPFIMKKLVSGELWVDKLLGEVIFKLEYRPDGDVCWHVWNEWKRCSARNSCDDLDNPVCYPLTQYRESFASTMKMPLPPRECQPVSKRPVNMGYQFQCKLTIKGWCQLRGFLLHAETVSEPLYDQITC